MEVPPAHDHPPRCRTVPRPQTIPAPTEPRSSPQGGHAPRMEWVMCRAWGFCRILTQLNRGAARAVFYGKRGELHQAYRESREYQLNALGLVVNAIVLWNTRYMEQDPGIPPTTRAGGRERRRRPSVTLGA